MIKYPTQRKLANILTHILRPMKKSMAKNCRSKGYYYLPAITGKVEDLKVVDWASFFPDCSASSMLSIVRGSSLCPTPIQKYTHRKENFKYNWQIILS